MNINTDDTFEIKAYQIMVYMRISRFLKLKVVIDEIKKPTKLLCNASLVGFLKANQQFILWISDSILYKQTAIAVLTKIYINCILKMIYG